MALSAGARIGPYEIAALIGAGGMGEVYRARDTNLKRDVAVKILPEAFSHDADRVARFQREAELLATLNHPNIAAVYGLERVGDTTTIVLELVDGLTVAEKLAAVGSGLPLEEALAIARQIAEALEAAHEKGIIHRDLKPANIKVTKDGVVKVLDFGLAKALDPPGEGSARRLPPGLSHSPTLSVAATMAGGIFGTAAYMSPEQARGKPVDQRADIWAFGCVLFEMLSGRQAFDVGETISDAVAAILKNEPNWAALPAITPASITRLLRRCLQKDPRSRVPHIGVARLEIDESAIEAIGSRSDAQPATLLHATRVPWLIAAGLFVACIALITVIVRGLNVSGAPAVQFTIAPPDGGVIGHALSTRGNSPPAPHFAVSPDGRQITYAVTQAGTTRLWVRPMDSLSAKSLPGTEEGSFPFWSPDSRFIAFFAQGKLKKIDPSGGPAQTICDAPAGEGGSWNRSGDVIFAAGLLEGLSRVPSSGGTAAPLTTLDAARNEMSHRWPQFLPDGQHFLYLARGATEDANAIWAGSLGSTQRTMILRSRLRFAYAAGYLLFSRGGELMAQSFDPRRLELSGEARRLLQEVASNDGNGRVGFSPSESGVVAFRTGSSGASTLLTWFDRSGHRLQALDASGLSNYEWLRLSPDESKLAIQTSKLEAGPTAADIWVFDLKRGGVPSRVTFTPSSVDTAPVWISDTRIAHGETGTGAIRISTLAGGNEPFLEPSDVNVAPLDWSARDGILLFQKTDERGSVDIWATPITPKSIPTPVLNSAFSERFARLSSDGRWLAYESDEGGQFDVYVRPFPVTGERKWAISTGGGFNPQWRRDGRELFYLTPDRKMMAVEIGGGATLEPRVPRALFETLTSPTAVGQYEGADNGQRFLIAERPTTFSPSPITVIVNWPDMLKK